MALSAATGTVGFPGCRWQQQHFPRGPSRISRGLSARSHTPLELPVIPPARHRWELPSSSGTVSSRGPLAMPATYREPLCASRVLAFSEKCPAPLQSELPALHRSIRAHAPHRNPPIASDLSLHDGSLQVAASPCWKTVVPGVISANPSLDAWTHTPAVLLVHLSVSSQKASAFTASGTAGHSTNNPYSDFSTGDFSGLQSFRNVQASRFACHPDRTYRCNQEPQGSHGVYLRASHGSLPPRAPDMLVVRIGQLTTWGLAPHKIRGIASRSPEVIPIRHRG